MDKLKALFAIKCTRIKSMLTPPIFDDEEKTRIARILSIILWAVIAVVSGLIFTWLVTQKSYELGPYALAANTVIVGAAICLLFLIRRGYVRIASFIFVFFLWGNITFQAFTSDGVRGSSSIIYMAIMVLASLLLGWRASIGFAVLSTGFIWVLAHIEMVGFTTFQLDGSYEVALEATVIFVLTAIFLTLATTGLNNALKRARRSEQSLKQSNRALQHNLEGLRQAAETLKESEERIRVLFEHAPDPFYINKIDGTLIDGNKAAEEFLGYKKEELIGTNFLEIGILSDADRPKALHLLEKSKDGEPTGPDEFTLYRKNGEPVYAEISTHPVNIRGEKLVLGIARDITERKNIEEETRKLEAKLQQAQKMEAIGTLAGGIAHDFNNILSAVIGYSEMAIDKVPEGIPLQGYLQNVNNAGHRAKDLVKQILTFSRQADLEVQPVQVKLIVKEAIKLLRASLPATIEICQNIQSEKAVLADPTQIHQVLMNLCTNASYAMQEKGGILEISLTDVVLDDIIAKNPNIEPGPYLRLNVSDTGLGIPAEIMGRIFEPYFTTKVKGEGTGLGLAAVHGIVEESGGAIKVYSEPGKGTTFHVYLPVTERKAMQAAKTDKSLALGNERILFIDDEKPLVDLGKRMLEGYGYEVTARTSSIEALELFKAKSEKFDLVITDLTMPNMTGKELARKVLHVRPNIPVILCTGFSEMITEESAKVLGIREFLMKPLTMQDLAGTVRKVLDENRL